MEPLATGFERSHLATRYRLLEAAARYIAAHGYAGTSVREVAAEAGVTSGAIYRHFPGGKDELYAESLKFVAESIRRVVLEQGIGSGTPLDIIVHQCAVCWDFFAAHPSFAALVARQGMDGGPTAPHFQDNVASVQIFQLFMLEAEKHGHIRKILPAHFVFAVGSYVINFHGAAALRDSVWPPEQQAQARETYLTFVRELLEPRERPPRAK
jgi:AcrR family transcriptional regulator